MQDIDQGLTQFQLEPENTKNLKAFVGELNGNIKILEKDLVLKFFKMAIKLAFLAIKKIYKKLLMQ